MKMKKYQSLMFTVFLCLASCGQATSEDKNSDSKINQWINSMKDNPCSKLHKVTSRDDLIQQMYDTAFQDDCLYEMSNEELEKIWGVPTVGRKKPSYTHEELIKDRTLVLNDNDVESPFDFFVYHDIDVISIPLTKTAFVKGNQSLFSTGSFPKFMGVPNSFELQPQMRESHFPTNHKANPDDQIQDGYIYYWRHERYQDRIILAETLPIGAVLGISFLKNNNTPFLK